MLNCYEHCNMKIHKYSILFSLQLILILPLSFIFLVNVFADDNIPSLNNWIRVEDYDDNSRVNDAYIKFDNENKTILLSAEVDGNGLDPSILDNDQRVNITKESVMNDCDFSGGWIGATDQGRDIIFMVKNGSDISRVQIDVRLDTAVCNKNFGSGFSGDVGKISDNSFRIFDIVVCGVRLGINGVFTSCENAEGNWFFYCPGCGSASGRWNAALDDAPPQNISGFAAAPGDALVTLNWGNPSDNDLNGVKIQRSQMNPPATPDEGITVFSGLGSSFEDTCVSNGKQYFYTAFSFDKVSNFSSGVSAIVDLK